MAEITEHFTATRTMNTETNFVAYKYSVHSIIFREGETISAWFMNRIPCDDTKMADLLAAIGVEFLLCDNGDKAHFVAANRRICRHIRETQTVGTLGVMDNITLFQGDRANKALLKRYESKSTTKCIDCLKELLHMELKPKETVPQIVARINETYAMLDDALSVQGQILVELIKIVALLAALSDSEYEVTRTVAESDVHLTFDKAAALLKHANERITSTMASKTSVAYYTTSKR